VPSRSDLAVGVVCVLLGAAAATWLVTDLIAGERTNAFQVLARVVSALFWLSLAAVALSDRLAVAGWRTAAASVAALFGCLMLGLLLTPDDFVNTTAKGPHSADQARALGLVLAALVVGSGGWVAWRFRRRSGH
jgi:hypothetical protein